MEYSFLCHFHFIFIDDHFDNIGIYDLFKPNNNYSWRVLRLHKCQKGKATEMREPGPVCNHHQVDYLLVAFFFSLTFLIPI